MIILVDMDNVIEQFVAGFVEYLNEQYGTDATVADVQDWDIGKAFPTLTTDQINDAVNDDLLWDHVRPMPGASEALQRLIAEGHKIYIVTATGYQTLPAKMEKVLFRYFSFLSWSQVIITENKHLIKGDVLIDDGPHNLTGGDYRKILFDANHNHSFDEKSIGAVRVHNWNDAYIAINQIAK